MKSKVAVVRCEDYSDATRAVKEAVNLIGGISSIIDRDEKVLIKPNVLSPSDPASALTTHPNVVRGVIKIAKRMTRSISLGDSPGISGYGLPEKALRISGMEELARDEKVKLVVFESKKPVRIKVLGSEVFIARDAYDADEIISVPKLKTHTLTIFTGAMKNIFGIVVGAEKQRMHGLHPDVEKFSSFICDLLKKFMPALSVMDAVVGKELEGSGGRLHRVGLILASRDPVALDAVASTIIGLDPENIPMTQIASKLGLGTASIDEIEVLGESIEELRFNFARPPTYLSPGLSIYYKTLAKKLGRPKPSVRSGMCKGCGACAEQCPVKAIFMMGVPKFDYSKCIRCYCCKEICPEGAIGVGPSLFRLGANLIDSLWGKFRSL